MSQDFFSSFLKLLYFSRIYIEANIYISWLTKRKVANMFSVKISSRISCSTPPGINSDKANTPRPCKSNKMRSLTYIVHLLTFFFFGYKFLYLHIWLQALSQLQSHLGKFFLSIELNITSGEYKGWCTDNYLKVYSEYKHDIS